MKKLFTTMSLLAVAGVSAFAQTKVTYGVNALIPGDERTLVKFEYQDKEASGAGQVWDFSGAKTMNNMVIDQAENIGVAMGNLSLSSTNTLLACNEGGEKDTYFEISKNQKMYWGLKSKNANIQFNEPIVDLAFPFAYGDIITGSMDGTYTENDGKVYPIEGQYFTSGDAWGTLTLPDGTTYNNVLRVKVEKTYKQPLSSLNYDIHTIRYQYFAPGVRYPVMIALVNEVKSDCNCACGYSRTEEAYYQPYSSMIAVRSYGTEESVKESADVKFELGAYPNPFKTTLIASVYSSVASKFTLELLDANGRSVKYYGEYEAEEGQNSITLNTSDLGIGHYVLRAVCNGETYTQAVVKK